MRSTSAPMRGVKPSASHSRSRSPYMPGAPGRRTRMNGSPFSSRSDTGVPPATPSSARRRSSAWSSGRAITISSSSRRSKRTPSGCCTGARSRAALSVPSASCSMASAALRSVKESVTRGNCRRHARSTSGVSLCAAAELVKPMASAPSSPRAMRCMRARICSMRANSSTASPWSAVPAAVSATPRGWRSNRDTPSSVSSAFSCWESGGCWMPSCSAARVTEPVSATARK
ncbi:hypothetical protein D3C72_958680 [compost metagenome]